MAKSYSVNLSVDEWRCVKQALLNDKNFCDDFNDEFMKSIVPKIDKKQRAQENLQNTITRKNKLIKALEEDIEGKKNQCVYLMEKNEEALELYTKTIEDLNEQLEESMNENELNAEASRMKSEDIKELKQKIEGLKGKIYELQNPVKEDHPDAEEEIQN